MYYVHCWLITDQVCLIVNLLYNIIAFVLFRFHPLLLTYIFHFKIFKLVAKICMNNYFICKYEE